MALVQPRDGLSAWRLYKYLHIHRRGYIITYMKALYFVGGSREDLRAFPVDARYQAGVDLRRVQSGLDPRDWKPMKIVGAGAREIRIRDEAGAFRIFYVVENEQAVYVLHEFQKKTQRTTKGDIEKGRDRYKLIDRR